MTNIIIDHLWQSFSFVVLCSIKFFLFLFLVLGFSHHPLPLEGVQLSLIFAVLVLIDLFFDFVLEIS